MVLLAAGEKFVEQLKDILNGIMASADKASSRQRSEQQRCNTLRYIKLLCWRTSTVIQKNYFLFNIWFSCVAEFIYFLITYLCNPNFIIVMC